ncbi:MAG: biopolymer transporter ExbD, partial [Burkholderiales bacterium]|nr:biopolymer transporter ExbD [Burkholderiales bacterium]
MNFRRASFREEPDINLVPFIDVLIVIVIFLAVTTTYSKYAELKINLPVADANTVDQPIDKLEIAISQTGQYFVNGREVPMESPLLFAETLRQIAGPDSDPVIIISADSNTT